MAAQGEVTSLLNRSAGGDVQAAQELWHLVYEELHRRAEGYFRDERTDHTLQPTALVNEAFVRLVGGSADDWSSRGQFLDVAARAMRRILVDHARRRHAAKRGGDWKKTPLESAALPDVCGDEQIEKLDESLERLASFDPQLARLVELHFFGGLTLAETGRLLDVSLRTAHRMWKLAKAWLYRDITDGG